MERGAAFAANVGGGFGHDSPLGVGGHLSVGQPGADEREFTAAEVLGRLIGVDDEKTTEVVVNGEDVDVGAIGEGEADAGEHTEESEESSEDEGAVGGDDNEDGNNEDNSREESGFNQERDVKNETNNGDEKSDSDGNETQEEVPFVPLFRKPKPILAALYAEYSTAAENRQASQEALAAARRALEVAKYNVAIAESEDAHRKRFQEEVRSRVWEAELIEPCKWNKRLAELRQFHAEHGHADVPYELHVKKATDGMDSPGLPSA